MMPIDGRSDDGELDPAGRRPFEEFLARAQDAQIGMQAELMIVRLERHLKLHAAYELWCREQGRIV